MDENISMYEERIGCPIDDLADEMLCLASIVVKNPKVAFRVKDPETLKKKMFLKGVKSVFSIDDVYGIRIIVRSVVDAYLVLWEISENLEGYLDHDYIEKPKASPSIRGNVLRLLQFIAYKNGVPFEIQITTATFNEVNEMLHEGYHCRKYHS